MCDRLPAKLRGVMCSALPDGAGRNGPHWWPSAASCRSPHHPLCSSLKCRFDHKQQPPPSCSYLHPFTRADPYLSPRLSTYQIYNLPTTVCCHCPIPRPNHYPGRSSQPPPLSPSPLPLRSTNGAAPLPEKLVDPL